MKYISRTTALVVLSLLCNTAQSQCNNNLYALSYAGVIYSVNPSTAALTAISSMAPNTNTSNALAYAGGTTPTFYFFANSNAGSLIFESYVPSTGVFTTLSMLNGPTGTVNSATISADYKGYYCLDSHGYLYYYRISSGKWFTIATTIRDQSGTDITANVAAYSSGDMAFDGYGNLWLLLGNSTNSKFGLYELPANVPTTNVGTVAIKQVVPLGSSMPDGYDPVGIAFNAAGQMYISTLNLTYFNSNLYLWNSTTTAPILVNSLSQVVLDLSSCSLPVNILPVRFEQVTATASSAGTINIYWQVAQQQNIKQFEVERSADGVHWQSIGSISVSRGAAGESYSYSDNDPLGERNYYQVLETDWNGKSVYSNIVEVQASGGSGLKLWPNPASEVLNVKNPFSVPVSVTLFDGTGRRLLDKKLQPGVNQIPLNSYPPGMFVLRATSMPSTPALTFMKTR
jgi:hypothetical protein